ncbi:MAG TPA: flagellar biosynthesis protein FlhB [Candidatus Acidoferrum sp.]|nr:flagellar biosynthesis protein FlhB [Candidatus Acidoferrum sp.]
MPDGSKTEKATPRKKRDQREKGNIFQSRDITGAAGLLVTLFTAKVLARFLFGYAAGLFPSFFESAGTVGALPDSGVMAELSKFVLAFFILALPILLVSAAAGIVLGEAQTRFLYAPELLKFKFSRLDPIAGFKRMFSARSFVELAKSAFKAALISLVLYSELKSRLPGALNLMGSQVQDAVRWLGDAVYGVLMKICAVMIAMGVLDYFYQWWEYERELRMTKQEVKDEYKNTEGDPAVKSRIKQIQNHIRHARMMQKVPTADVVVRNPTHFAVAIRYEEKKKKAPVVVAKGQDLVALKIVEAAENAGVTVMENKPLARGLYEAVPLDAEIPERYYQAVAEVLAYVYTLKRGGQRR